MILVKMDSGIVVIGQYGCADLLQRTIELDQTRLDETNVKWTRYSGHKYVAAKVGDQIARHMPLDRTDCNPAEFSAQRVVLVQNVIP